MVPRFRVFSLDHPGIAAAAAIAATLLACNASRAQSLCAQDPTSGGCELVLPPVCSRNELVSSAPPELCEITNSQGSSGKRVQINLKAVSADIRVGGYTVNTENYNASYLSPVLEVHPGDTAAARVENALGKPPEPSSPAAGHQHSHAGNPTNLHFFHGGVVTPRNARRPTDPGDTAATSGDGDNVYSYLRQGDQPFVYHVPIPTLLDARVLDQSGTILHPSGLNWYHSHLHGISSRQVMGGLSGLLSVGDAKANVVACLRDPTDDGKCQADESATNAATEALRARTDVRYGLLRDINLKIIDGLPEGTEPLKTASWVPDTNQWPLGQGDCKVWRSDASPAEGEKDAKLRKGYCQANKGLAWLFTVNGQRFPTITVEGGRNLLLRLGNLSANVVYHLELYNEQNETDRQSLTLLGIDGVVPATTVTADPNRQPVKATAVEDLVFMPASRAEVYLRNDCLRDKEATYVLRTKGLIAGKANAVSDRWPEIQLMRIVFRPSTVSCTDQVALNAAVSQARFFAASARTPQIATRPKGCVDDIEPAKFEHRRVGFYDDGFLSSGKTMPWGTITDIMQPPAGVVSDGASYSDFTPDLAKSVGMKLNPSDTFFVPIAFEEYVMAEGKIDWDNTNDRRPHVCIFANPGDPAHKSSQQQLWVLENQTAALHNFHIHQMKFRLATATELTSTFKIKLQNEPSEVCADTGRPPPCPKGPIYRLYEKESPDQNTQWHDTIPMPALDANGNPQRVYIIMSFVAEEQIGRYVFHCHILKHEDAGLMAPIEVWKPTTVLQ